MNHVWKVRHLSSKCRKKMHNTNLSVPQNGELTRQTLHKIRDIPIKIDMLFAKN